MPMAAGPDARVYLPDTNVLVNDPDSLTKLGRGNVVVIAYPVVRELDHLKDALNGDGRRRAARRQDRSTSSSPGASRRACATASRCPTAGCLVFDDNILEPRGRVGRVRRAEQRRPDHPARAQVEAAAARRARQRRHARRGDAREGDGRSA